MYSLFIGLLYYCLLISSDGDKCKEKLHVLGNKKPAVSGNIIKEVTGEDSLRRILPLFEKTY